MTTSVSSTSLPAFEPLTVPPVDTERYVLKRRALRRIARDVAGKLGEGDG